MSKLEAVNVTGIDPEQLYTARLEFRAKGSTDAILPSIEYSHHFPDDYEGPFPASYLAMRDLALMLSGSVEMLPNTEIDELPDDPDERAELAIAQHLASQEEPN